MNAFRATCIKGGVSWSPSVRQAVPTIATSVVVFLLVLSSSPAQAAPSLAAPAKRNLSLTYDVSGVGVDDCPDEPTMRQMVAAELGYDPFGQGSSEKMTMRFRGEQRGLIARLEQGTSSPRELRSALGDCDELASSVALAAALMIDPTFATRERSPAPSLSAAGATPPAAVPPPMSSAAASRVTPVTAAPRDDVAAAPADDDDGSPVGVTAFVGTVVGAGLVPGVSFGPYVGVGIDGTLWSVALEAGGIVPGTAESSSGHVTASLVRGGVVPCFALDLAPVVRGALCATLELGAMFSEASAVERSRPSTDLHATLGPRLAIQVEPGKMFGFRVGANLELALARVHLSIDDAGTTREIWSTPQVAALGDAAFLVRLQ